MAGGNSRQRRKFNRAVANHFPAAVVAVMPTTIPKKQEFISRGDVALWCLAGVMAVALYLAPEKTPLWICAGLVCMVALATHPTLYLPWVRQARSTRIRLRRSVAALLVMATIVGLYGWTIWPPARRHTLRQKERRLFENALKPQEGDELEIQIACPLGDEKDCVYAGQFVNLIGESGWKVESYVTRTILTRAQDGITIYRRGGNKDYSLKHYDAGGYFQINEPHLLAIQKAFQSIHIEPDSGTNPDLAENIMQIYFGPEKENEAEPTNLTKTTEWVTGQRKGTFPGQRQSVLCRWLGLMCI